MNTEPVGPIRAKDIFLFLIGRPDSIRRVVASPWSLVIGILLVWSAGIARHYDLHYLHEVTTWTWAPFLVVMVSSVLVFICTYLAIIGFSGKSLPNFFVQYPSFLGAFLLTAPIAWIYAIPVEHFTNAEPLASAKWNIAFLAIASFWRVWLIVVVIKVITLVPWWKALLVVLLPVSAEAFFGAALKTLDIVGMMGGFELSPTEEFRKAAYDNISRVSFILACAGLLLIWIPIGKENRGKGGFVFSKQPVPRQAVFAAFLILIAWVALCIPVQMDPEKMEPRRSMEKMYQERVINPERVNEPSKIETPQ